MKLDDRLIAIPFRMIQLAFQKRLLLVRRRKSGFAGSSNTLEPRKKLPPPLFDRFRQRRIVIGKIEERARSAEFLALKKQGRAWRDEQQGRQGAVDARAGEAVQPF